MTQVSNHMGQQPTSASCNCGLTAWAEQNIFIRQLCRSGLKITEYHNCIKLVTVSRHRMRHSICIVFLFLAKASIGQIRVKNTDVVNSDSAIVFRDVINHVKVEGIKDFTHHQVAIEGGMLSLAGGNELLVIGIKSDTVTFHVFTVAGKTKKEVYSAVFRAQNAGEPSVQLKEEYDQTFSNGQTVNRTSLEVVMSNSNYGGNWEVAHFEISLQDPTGNIVLPPTFVSGKYLGKTIYDRVEALPSGGKILFSQVILTYAGAGYHKYKDFALRKK